MDNKYERLINTAETIWNRKFGINEMVQTLKKGVDKIELPYGKTWTDSTDSLVNSLNTAASSKKGNYYEELLKYIIVNFSKDEPFYKTIEVEDEKNGIKNCNAIRIPKKLYTFIQNEVYIEGKEGEIDFRNADDVKGLIEKLYNETIKYKNKKIKGPLTEFNFDLDMGVINDAGKVFIYEIKSNGYFGADVKSEHTAKLYTNFCNYVYNKDIDLEDIFFSFVFVTEEKNKYFTKGKGGFITLDDFLKNHNIKMDDEIKIKVFQDVCCMNSELAHKLIDRVKGQRKKRPEFFDKNSKEYRSPTEFAKFFKKAYSTQFNFD